jgi:hypothetical protein
LTFLSHFKFYSNFGGPLFCQNCQWDFLPFLKFLSTYLYILYWILGISSKCCLCLPGKMHWICVSIWLQFPLWHLFFILFCLIFWFGLLNHA